jgi:hypothetical protein
VDYKKLIDIFNGRFLQVRSQEQIVLIFKLPFSGIIEVPVSLRASVSAEDAVDGSGR